MQCFWAVFLAFWLFSGPKGRGFKSRRPDHLKNLDVVWVLCFSGNAVYERFKAAGNLLAT